MKHTTRKPAFPYPFMVIRLWPQHHSNGQLLKDLLKTLQRHRDACDEVWFCTEFSFPTLEAHRRSAELMSAAAEKVRSAGFLPGLQIANTLGHSDALTIPADGIQWQRMVGADGQTAQSCNCPRDPDFHRYLRQTSCAYAAWQPTSVWIDDDLRMNHHAPVSYGCFCKRCLADFSRQQTTSWNRQTLVKALTKPEDGRTRLAWTKFGQQSMATLARAIAESVHSVAPTCRMGLQHCGHEWGVYNGPDWEPVFTAMANATNMPVGSRPGGGFYADHAPRGMINKAFDIARQCERLPKSVSVICPEIENFSHTAMGKTPQGTAVESTLDLAMGCNALSYAILCAEQEPMAWYANLLKKLASWRPFWEMFVKANAGTVPAGMAIALGRSHAGRKLRPGEDGFAWASNSFGEVYPLSTIGLPLCANSSGACGTLLHASAVDGLRDKEIEQILRGGTLTDGHAIMRLQDRGFEKLLGLRAELRPASSFEYFTADPLNASHAGHVWKIFFSSSGMYTLIPTSKKARILGEYRNADGTISGAATVLAPTAVGGRLAVFGYAGWESIVSSARRFQLLAAADWLTGGQLPVIIDTPAQVMAVPRVDTRGQIRSVLLLNATIDNTPALKVRLRGTRARSLQWIVPTNQPREIRSQRQDDEIVLTVPPMKPWTVGWLQM